MNDIYTRLQEHARLTPDKPAVWEYVGNSEFRCVSRGELAGQAEVLAAKFRQEVEPGHAIPILMGRTATCVAAILGALGAGLPFSCINPKYRGPQIECILTSLGSPLVLAEASTLVSLRTEFQQGSVLSDKRWIIVPRTRDQQLYRKMLSRIAQGVDIEELSLSPHAKTLAACGEGQGNVGCCLFTSGSTGEPKGVLISVDDLRDRAVAEVDWYGLTEADVLLNLLPFSFDVGLNQLLSVIWAGSEVVLLNSWMPADILRVCEMRGITGISNVPSIWRDMLAADAVIQRKVGRRALRYVTISGGDLDSKGLESLPRIVPGAGIYKTYGQTETFRSSSLHPDDYPSRPTSVGRAFGRAKFYIVDDAGACCGPNVEGQVVHTGLGTMIGYLCGMEQDEKLRPNPFYGDSDSATQGIFTGDFGYTDCDGYLYLRGRRDDMVKIQGNRVYPAEVAAQLMRVDGITAAEVLPVGLANGMTTLCAFVSGMPHACPSLSGLRIAVTKRLPSYMVPSYFVFRDALPRTPNGKIDRMALYRHAATVAGTTNALSADSYHVR